jgi:hypothetical protein
VEESRRGDIHKCYAVNWLHVQRLDWKWDRLLFWEQQSSLHHNEWTNQRNGRLYSKSNTYTNANCYADPDLNSNTYNDSNSEPNTDSDAYPN